MLLRERAAAIVHHDRAAFLATLDPASGAFRHTQARMFADLTEIRFASWSYSFIPVSVPVPRRARARYAAPTWAPVAFRLHYRIAGFDKAPTDLRQYPTFVERSGRWYLGSLRDFAGRGQVSAAGLWDFAPVHVIRRPSVLVLGPRSELGTMARVADQMQAAIPRVDAVWGRRWSQRVIVAVPATQHEMALITSDTADLDQIAALTSSEVATVHGRSSPVGDRVTINPANWPRLGTLGSEVVLTHELTHVATRADSTSATPKWLSEGFADYVGFLDSGVPVPAAAAELATRVSAGDVPARLPGDRAFRGSSASLPTAYESSWLACRLIAQRYGRGRLVRFYRAVGRSGRGQQAAVADALHRLFGLSTARFTSMWRGYLRSELG